MWIQKLSVDEIAKIFFHISSKKKYANHQFVIFLIIRLHHNGISSFSCIHGKRRPSGNENGHRQSKQWLCWDHSMSLESFDDWDGQNCNISLMDLYSYIWEFAQFVVVGYVKIVEEEEKWKYCCQIEFFFKGLVSVHIGHSRSMEYNDRPPGFHNSRDQGDYFKHGRLWRRRRRQATQVLQLPPRRPQQFWLSGARSLQEV